jgi:hypothetical protein
MIITCPVLKAASCVMIHRHNAIDNDDSNRQFSCILLYVILCNIYSFLMYFLTNLFYISKSVRLIHEERERCKEEKIDSEIFKR